MHHLSDDRRVVLVSYVAVIATRQPADSSPSQAQKKVADPIDNSICRGFVTLKRHASHKSQRQQANEYMLERTYRLQRS